MLVLNSKCRWWLEGLTRLPLLCSYWSYSCESSSWLVVSMSVCWREAWGPEFGFQHPNKKPGCKLSTRRKEEGQRQRIPGGCGCPPSTQASERCASVEQDGEWLNWIPNILFCWPSWMCIHIAHWDTLHMHCVPLSCPPLDLLGRASVCGDVP